MDNDRISIGIGDHNHVADGRVEWAHLHRGAGGLQRGHGVIEVLHLECHRAPIGAGFPTFGLADPERPGADFVFDPMPAATGGVILGLLEPEHTLIEFLRAGDVGDSVGGEGNFGDFHKYK